MEPVATSLPSTVEVGSQAGRRRRSQASRPRPRPSSSRRRPRLRSSPRQSGSGSCRRPVSCDPMASCCPSSRLTPDWSRTWRGCSRRSGCVGGPSRCGRSPSSSPSARRRSGSRRPRVDGWGRAGPPKIARGRWDPRGAVVTPRASRNKHNGRATPGAGRRTREPRRLMRRWGTAAGAVASTGDV